MGIGIEFGFAIRPKIRLLSSASKLELGMDMEARGSCSCSILEGRLAAVSCLLSCPDPEFLII